MFSLTFYNTVTHKMVSEKCKLEKYWWFLVELSSQLGTHHVRPSRAPRGCLGFSTAILNARAFVREVSLILRLRKPGFCVDVATAWCGPRRPRVHNTIQWSRSNPRHPGSAVHTLSTRLEQRGAKYPPRRLGCKCGLPIDGIKLCALGIRTRVIFYCIFKAYFMPYI